MVFPLRSDLYNTTCCTVGIQQVFQALEVFSSEGSSAFSVMSAAVSQTNSIELIGKRYQQVCVVFS